MYGQDSGYKGYLDNMVWQILELQKRFVNKNYILSEMINIFCVLYHFHVENMQNCPLNTEASMNWIRGYYDLIIRPHENEITETMMMQAFAQTAAQQTLLLRALFLLLLSRISGNLLKSPGLLILMMKLEGLLLQAIFLLLQIRIGLLKLLSILSM